MGVLKTGIFIHLQTDGLLHVSWGAYSHHCLTILFFQFMNIVFICMFKGRHCYTDFSFLLCIKSQSMQAFSQDLKSGHSKISIRPD